MMKAATIMALLSLCAFSQGAKRECVAVDTIPVDASGGLLLIRNTCAVKLRDVYVVVRLYDSQDYRIGSTFALVDAVGRGEKIKAPVSYPSDAVGKVAYIRVATVLTNPKNLK